MMSSVNAGRRDRVLVTGAGGFIGSHLTEALIRSGADVTALVHYNARSHWGNLELLDRHEMASVNVVLGDVRDAHFVRTLVRGKTHVFHLAALIAIPYSYHAPGSYLATNVEGTLNVLQAALEAGVERVIQVSTSEVYGTARYVPIDEAHPLQAQSPYAASKIGADKLAESFHASFGLPVVTVRPFNTYGPRQSARAVIPTIVTQALAGGPVRLGSLKPVRDLCFVADTVNGFILAARAPQAVGQVVNLGTGAGVTIGDLARQIFDLLGIEPELVEDTQRVRPENSEVLRLVASAVRARELLAWAPAFDLARGLALTIEWFRQNAGLYKHAIYNI